MMLHPFILAVIVLDLVSLFFLCRAAGTAIRTEAGWSPGSSTRRQIRLETAYETGAISARAVLVLMAVSTSALVFGVTNVLPEMVPGAMCGTGVIQATGGQGGRAFLFRFVALALLYLWSRLESLNRVSPDFPMARLNSRLLLLASPFVFLALLDTFNGFGSLDVHKPVDCCTVVYDRLSAGGETRNGALVNDDVLAPLFAVFTFLLVLFGVAALKGGPKQFGRFSAASAVISLAWAPIAGTTLVRVFAVYYYEVLHHYCPWCLFLPEHKFAGFPLFLLLGAAFIQPVVAYALHRASGRSFGMEEPSTRKAKRALVWMIVFTALFTLLAVWPALSWRFRFGVWMG
jgi:hypothetical protein